MAQNTLYREIMLDHYHNPRNYGLLEKYMCMGESENISCGDKVVCSVSLANDIIDSVGFEAEGCAVTISCASMMYEYFIGKTVDCINETEPEVLLEKLGITLTPSRIKCGLVAYQAIKKAVYLVNII